MDLNSSECTYLEKDNKSLRFLFKLFSVFFRIGAFTFGGGFAMIPIIEREIVDENKWMDSEEFLDIVSITQSAPGAVSINTAVFIGYKLAGIPGAIFSTFGTVIPPFFIILIIAKFFSQFKRVEIIGWIFSGIRPAVVGLILIAARTIGRKIFLDYRYISLTIGVLICLLFFDIHPVLLILIGGIIGALFFRPQ